MEYIHAQHSCYYMLLSATSAPALILPLDSKFQNSEVLTTSRTELTHVSAVSHFTFYAAHAIHFPHVLTKTLQGITFDCSAVGRTQNQLLISARTVWSSVSQPYFHTELHLMNRANVPLI